MATTTARRAGRRTTTSKSAATRTAGARTTKATAGHAAPRVTTRLAQRARGIVKRRQKLGMSRIELARRAGCSATMLRNLEMGDVPATSEALPRVLAVLDEAEG